MSNTDVRASRKVAQIEAVERRTLLASVVSGILQVSGTAGDDQIELSSDSGGRIVVAVNDDVQNFDPAHISSISILAGAGDDVVRVATDIAIPAAIFGEDGDDVLAGGGGNDTFDGGDGSDTLDYSIRTDALTISGADPNIIHVGSGGEQDQYAAVETLTCGSGDDAIYVSGDYNSLRLINGGAGDDSLSYFATRADVDATLHGGAGNDRLEADGGASSWDSIDPPITPATVHYFGDAGDDDLWVPRYFVKRDLHGGSGIDKVDYSSYTTRGIGVTLDEQANDGPDGFDNVHNDIEIVVGSVNGDHLVGDDSPQTLYGSSGNDVLIGGGGDDWLDAGLYPGYGNTLNGGTGHDTLLAPTHNDSIISDADDVVVIAGVWQINGTSGDDVITVGPASGDPSTVEVVVNGKHFTLPKSALVNVINYATPGQDSILPINLPGGFYIDTGNGNDSVTIDQAVDLPATIQGGGGNDSLVGGSGNDSLNGGTGNDVLFGGDGNDILIADSPADSLNGGAGDDTLRQTFPPAPAPMRASLASGVLAISGTNADDRIEIRLKDSDPTRLELVLDGVVSGYALANVTFVQIDARGGNDRIEFGPGLAMRSKIYGGAGNDVIYGSAAADRIYGGAGNDWISAGGGNDAVFGDDGADRIFGGAGDDMLDGGAGVDVIRGDVGHDQLIATLGLDDLKGNRGDLITDTRPLIA